MVVTNNENSNPLANPATLFAAYVTSVDVNWNGKYIDASGNASATAVWLTDAQLTSLTVNSMAINTSYTIGVKARNQNSVETAVGATAALSTTNDATAPTPNPSTFSSAPAPASASSVSMTGSTATDAAGSTPVNYSFAFSACGANGGTGGTSSSWQSSASYTDSGLQPNQCYGYTTQSKDAASSTPDLSGSGNTGTLLGFPAVVAGQSGDGMNFSAIGDIMVLNSAISLAGGTYSIVAWIKAPLPSCAGYCTLTRGATYDHQVLVNPSHLLGVFDNAGGTGFYSSGFDVTTLAAGWHHLAAVGSGTNTVFYIDGSSVGTAAFKSTAQISYVGAYQGGSQQFGIIDDMRIFNTALTSGNVTTLYGGGTISTGLVGQWTFETIGNSTTASSQSTTYTLANVPSAPTLSGATAHTMVLTNNENSNPSASPTTYFAAYVTSADANWNTKYVAANGSASATAVWLTDAQLTSLTLTGMALSTSYTIGVKARNESTTETALGATSALSTAGDTTAPTPNPATFSTAPAPDSASQVSMIASTATDADGSTPVAYSFAFSACGANGGTGGTSSGWQAGASYSDSGLQPNQCYGYTIQSRDAIPNTGTASSQNTTYTHANAPGTPSLTQPSQTTLQITNDQNSNPSANPTTKYAAQIIAAGDSTWNNQYANASGNPSASAVWLTNAQLNNLVITGLTAGVSYEVKVKARNENTVETSFSATGSNTTSSTVDTTARYLRLRGVRLRGVRLLYAPDLQVVAMFLRRPLPADML